MKGYDETSVEELVQLLTPEQLAERLRIMTRERNQRWDNELALRTELQKLRQSNPIQATSVTIGADGRHE